MITAPPAAPRRRSDPAPAFTIGEAELAPLARGCAVLGAGGGGPIRSGLLAAKQAIRDRGPVTVIAAETLSPEALVMPCGSMGAAAVADEAIGDGREGSRLVAEVEAITGREVTALMASEIGGLNGLLAVAWAAGTGLPLIDADGMGRAFSRMTQVAMELAGIPMSPCVVTDHRGGIARLQHAESSWIERAAGSLARAAGGSASTAEYLMRGDQLAQATIPGSITRALRIGRAVQQPDPITALLSDAGAARLLDGRVTEIDWAVRGGRSSGVCVLEGIGGDRGRRVRVELGDDLLIAVEEGRVIAAVPDAIAALAAVDRRPVTAEHLRFGQRLTLLSLPADPIWFSPAGLKLVGPEAYGYHLQHPRAPQEARS